jgi:hypothetical protein
MSYTIYHADLASSKGVLINNPGGPYDNEKLADFQSDFCGNTYVILDASNQGFEVTKGIVEGDDVLIKYGKYSHEIDIVQVDAQTFIGDFELTLKSIQSEDKLYISNVVSFTAFGSKGPLGDTYTGQNVYGGGESGDQNGAEFGDGTYHLGVPVGAKVPKFYEITYFDRDGNLRTITLDGTHQTPTLALDYICFARGTLIEVEGGVKPVEDLLPGDRVRTKDSGYQPLQWIASRRLGADELARNPDIRPIRIRAGALGADMPRTDLVVSPQHRMLVDDWRCEALFGETEMLAPAKALVNDRSITVDHDAVEVQYFHFMFDKHEIVYANGVESESFHPGDFGLSTLDEAALNELFLVFPHLAHDVNAFGVPARPVLRTFEARAMLSA